MGLDVGVVNITYLERPDEPIYDFLWAIAEGGVDEDWGGGWLGNALVEYERESLIEKAAEWADGRGLEAQQRAQLFDWLEALPWHGDTVMLHLNW
jgi:hypothetical protein